MNDVERDIQKLWHDQPREGHVMSIDDIRAKANRFEHKVRRWNVVSAVTFPLIIAIETWQVWVGQNAVERVGDALTIAALAVVAVEYFRYSTIETMPAGLGRTSSVEFYRRQLARQRDLGSKPWRYLALFVPGVTLSLFAGQLDRPPAQLAAVAAVGVALFLVVAWIQTRTARRLQNEIDELS